MPSQHQHRTLRALISGLIIIIIIIIIIIPIPLWPAIALATSCVSDWQFSWHLLKG